MASLGFLNTRRHQGHLKPVSIMEDIFYKTVYTHIKPDHILQIQFICNDFRCNARTHAVNARAFRPLVMQQFLSRVQSVTFSMHFNNTVCIFLRVHSTYTASVKSVILTISL